MPLPLSVELDALVRLLAAAVVVLWAWPRVALPDFSDLSPGDAAVSRAVLMLLYLMVLGYVLAAIHLFYWLVLVAALVAVRFTRPPKARNAYELHPRLRASATALEYLDRISQIPEWALTLARAAFHRHPHAPRTLLRVAGWCVFAVVLGVAAWMRLATAFDHASIPFSDSTVVLYWVKAIGNQAVFPNGIYPEGFHVFIADLARLGTANPIVSVKFFGPLVGAAMVASVGYATYRMTGRLAPAIVAMLLYGTLPQILPNEFLRQVGTDSQEFGNALVLPTLWFCYVSWAKRSPTAGLTTLALLAALGLTHPIAGINGALAALAATAAVWLVQGVHWPTLGWYLRYVWVAVAIAVAPIAIALALGMHIYGSAAQFIGSQFAGGPPPLTTLEYASAAAAALLFLVRLMSRAGRRQLAAPLAGLLSLCAAVGVVELPAVGIHSLVLASRADEFVALAEALCLGLGFSAGQELLEFLSRRAGAWIALAAAVGLAACAWVRFTPVPIDAYQGALWDPDDFVAQFVRIGDSLPHGSWLAVADNNGFDYTYGQSFFMTGKDFSLHVRPSGRWFVYVQNNGTTERLAEDHIFLFLDKRTVVASAYRYAVGKQRHDTQRQIRAWVSRWAPHDPKMHLYYDGPDLRVWELTSPSVTGSTGALARTFALPVPGEDAAAP